MSKVEMLRCVLREKHSCAEANGICYPPPHQQLAGICTSCVCGGGGGV